MATTTPIKYKLDYNPDELIQVTLSQLMVGGENRKRKVPKAKENSIESVLQVMIEFDEVSRAEVLDFDGADLYNNFRSVLPASLRDDWDETVQRLGVGAPARTEATFRNCQRQWMTSFISEGAAEDLKEYIETALKKDREDSIHHLVTRSKTLRKRHFQLLARGQPVAPVEGQKITDRELIRAMYRGLPQKWKDNFLLKYSLQNCDMMQFQAFMIQQKAAHDRNEQASKAQKDRNKKNHSDTRPGSRKRTHSTQGTGSNKNKNKCRKHPHLDHDWMDCFDNPRGRNYRPRDANGRYLHPSNNRNDARSGNNYNHRQGNGGQSHQQRQAYYQGHGPPTGNPPVPVRDGRTQGGTPYQLHGDAYYNGASMTREVEPSSSSNQSLQLQQTNRTSPLLNPLQEDHLIIQHSLQTQGTSGTLSHPNETHNHAVQDPIPLTQTNDDKGPHLSPATVMHAEFIQGASYELPLRVLFDPGSDGSHFHERCIPKNITPRVVPSKQGVTIGGLSTSNREITLKQIIFPEFNKHHSVNEHTFQVYGAPSFYDAIIGKDLLYKVGAAVDLQECTMTAFGFTIPMRIKERLENRTQSFLALFRDPDTYFFHDTMEHHSVQRPRTTILESKYEKIDIKDVIKEQHHLNEEDKQSLRRVLARHTRLFDGQVGRYPHRNLTWT